MRATTWLSYCLFGALAVVGCAEEKASLIITMGSPATASDASRSDAGASDAGRRDGGAGNASARDGGQPRTMADARVRDNDPPEEPEDDEPSDDDMGEPGDDDMGDDEPPTNGGSPTAPARDGGMPSSGGGGGGEVITTEMGTKIYLDPSCPNLMPMVAGMALDLAGCCVEATKMCGLSTHKLMIPPQFASMFPVACRGYEELAMLRIMAPEPKGCTIP